MKRGRKRIKCVLGSKKRHTINCYDLEWQQICIEFQKLKKQRVKYYIQEDNNETIE